MSRIHEALKKAAAERAFVDAARTAPDLIEILKEPPPAVPNEAQDLIEIQKELPPPVPKEAPLISPQGRTYQPKGPSFIRFDELRERCSHPSWKPDPHLNVFNDQESEKRGAEGFRTLRSRLHQIAAARKLKRVLVTSSVPAEGKTFVAANLALSIVRQPDRRVLLIDADLRASRLHLAFGAPSTPGLTDYLLGEADMFSVIQNGMAKNLYLIPGGGEVTNPSELLLNERMKELLDATTPVFDFVIMDSPPAIPVHDPNLLADFCDGTLFVVRAGQTNFEIALRAATQFERKNLLGVVLNAVGPGDATFGEYYGSYYSSVGKQ